MELWSGNYVELSRMILSLICVDMSRMLVCVFVSRENVISDDGCFDSEIKTEATA